MSFYLVIHFESEAEQPTKAQCEAVANAVGKMLVEVQEFRNVGCVMLEVPEPSDLTAADLRRPN
jgi:hypothetical protein